MGNMLTAVNIDRIEKLLDIYKKLSADEEADYLAYREDNKKMNEWDCMERYFEQNGYI